MCGNLFMDSTKLSTNTLTQKAEKRIMQSNGIQFYSLSHFSLYNWQMQHRSIEENWKLSTIREKKKFFFVCSSSTDCISYWNFNNIWWADWNVWWTKELSIVLSRLVSPAVYMVRCLTTDKKWLQNGKSVYTK